MADKAKNVPAKGKSTDLATASMDALASVAGAGFQNVRPEDQLMPRITILQDLSPQVKKRNAEYVEGAEPGKVFNVASQEVADKLIFLPCAYIRHHIEWKPNRGGFVRDHGDDASIMDRVKGQNETNFDVLDNGNLIVPTGTWYGLDLVSGQRVVIPMSRTQMKPSRKLMSLATSVMLEHKSQGKFQAPLFYRAYELVPVERSDDTNTWFVWSVTPGASILELAKEPGKEGILQEALAFQKLVLSGEVRAKAEDFQENDQEAQGSGQGASGTY